MKTGVVLLSLMLGLALAAGPANVPGTVDRTTDNNPLAPDRAPGGTSTALMDPPDTAWTRALATTYTVGVTDAQDSLMWVSAGQSELKIYIIKIGDPARPLIDSFAQTGGPSGWGIRDMAYKSSTDEVFAGFDGQRFHVYNATTHVPNNTYTVSGYSGTVRGFGYSPAEDSCWTCNFTTSPMAKFSITGTNGHQVKAAAQMGSSYGLAYDATRGCFWIPQAGAAGASPVWKMSYPGYAVVDSFLPGTGYDLGGGAEMWRGDSFLLVMEQGTPDVVWCFIMEAGAQAAHDVSLAQIMAPGTNMNPGTVTPKALIRNLGTSSETGIPVTCWIDSSGTRVYSQTATYAGTLAPGAADSIAMPVQWTTGPAGNSYNVTFFTALSGDEVPRNDTARQVTRTTGAIFSDTIVVKRIAVFAPTIDGNIQPGEWSASFTYDISDLAGRGGTPQPAGSNFAYYMYDDNFMYYAMDCPTYSGRTDYDQFGPYTDENYSRTWSTDSSEGNYWMEMVTNDEVVYRAILNTQPQVWLMGVTPGAQMVSSTTSGHLQFEAKVPFGTQRYQLTISPGDTVGYFQYTAVSGGSNFIGWWPQSLTSAQWANPQYYGMMYFDPSMGAEEVVQPGRPYALYTASPSPMRDFAHIGYYVGRTSNVNLGIYDASGSLVKTLASGTMQPGERSAVWNRTDANGRRVANGTYFYRLTVDGEAISGKAIVLN